MSRSAQLLRGLAPVVPTSAVRWLGRAQFEHPLLARLIERVSSPIRDADMPIVRGPAAGLWINAAGTNPGYVLGTTEPAVQEALVKRLGTGDVFFDVGAGIGFFTLIGARIVGPEGGVVAFEPNPWTASVLRHNIELNGFENVHVIQSAVSGRRGRSRISLAGTASRLLPGEDGTEVEVLSIDDVVTDFGARPPALVKLDVEGVEAQALEGMRRTLDSARPVIVCETHGTLGSVRQVLAENGYHTELLDPMIGGATTWNVHVLALPVGG